MKNNKDNISRFLVSSPSSFKVVGFLVSYKRTNDITGMPELAIDCHVSHTKPLDITPFLNKIQQVTT